jgi:hypothetical protein
LNIQFVRLDLDVCEVLNRLALQQRRTVSDLVNEMLRSRIAESGELPAEDAASR